MFWCVVSIGGWVSLESAAASCLLFYGFSLDPVVDVLPIQLIQSRNFVLDFLCEVAGGVTG